VDGTGADGTEPDLVYFTASNGSRTRTPVGAKCLTLRVTTVEPCVRAVAAIIYSGHFPIAAVWVVGFTASMSAQKLPHIISSLKSATEQISIRLSPFLSEKAESGR